MFDIVLICVSSTNCKLSKPLLEEGKDKDEVSPTRNALIEEIQWQKQK